jgi:diguanylate cyclase (GGDEF)-like protein
MSILVVDDSAEWQLLMSRLLRSGGYTDVRVAGTAGEAFRHLGLDGPGDETAPVDLVLMDIVMPGVDGIEACRRMKSREESRDIPVLMITAMVGTDELELAYAAGAADYIQKPVDRAVLLSRVDAALRLKRETEARKMREQELIEAKQLLERANEALHRLASLDGLTGLSNRRHFDETLQHEWNRTLRDGKPLSLLLIDVDRFKDFNDTYGHQAGDECLKQVAETLREAVYRPGDTIARYGGEELTVVLPGIDAEGAAFVAERLREAVEALRLSVAGAPEHARVTVSLGVACARPAMGGAPADLVAAADRALYRAKRDGRNCARLAG